MKRETEIIKQVNKLKKEKADFQDRLIAMKPADRYGSKGQHLQANIDKINGGLNALVWVTKN